MRRLEACRSVIAGVDAVSALKRRRQEVAAQGRTGSAELAVAIADAELLPITQIRGAKLTKGLLKLRKLELDTDAGGRTFKFASSKVDPTMVASAMQNFLGARFTNDLQ